MEMLHWLRLVIKDIIPQTMKISSQNLCIAPLEIQKMYVRISHLIKQRKSQE
jgi:hypothetical protein